MVLRPDGCGSASDSTRIHEVAPGGPDAGSLSPVGAGPHRVIGSVSRNSDHERIQQRVVKEPIMVSGDLHAVTVPLDVFRDILIELAAALRPDRATRVFSGNRPDNVSQRPGRRLVGAWLVVKAASYSR